MNHNQNIPDSTLAVRECMWRALHLLVDAKPAILVDDVGLKLVAPADDSWRQRPDMHPQPHGSISRLYRG